MKERQNRLQESIGSVGGCEVCCGHRKPSAMEGKAMILLESTPLAAAIARMLFTPSELKSISTSTASLADFSAKIQALNVPESTLAGRENAASTWRQLNEGRGRVGGGGKQWKKTICCSG